MDFVYVKLTLTLLSILFVKVLCEATNPSLLTEDMYCKLNCLDYFDRDDLKLTPKTIQCRCPILQVEIDGDIHNVPVSPHEGGTLPLFQSNNMYLLFDYFRDAVNLKKLALTITMRFSQKLYRNKLKISFCIGLMSLETS